MGFTYTIDHEHRLVRARGWGVLAMPDIEEFYSRLQGDPGFDPTYHSLGDLRDVTEIVVSSNELAASAALPVFSVGSRRALVASRDAVYGMLRAFATFNDRMGQTMRIFRRMEIARAWIESGDDTLLATP